jgi:hypothetical protein
MNSVLKSVMVLMFFCVAGVSHGQVIVSPAPVSCITHCSNVNPNSCWTSCH